MSHGIVEDDRGVVFGTTWHNLPQYIQQDKPVTIEQAKTVLDYPLQKVRLQRQDTGEIVDACCVIRSDTNRVLVPHAGMRYEPLNNTALLDCVEQGLLRPYPELQLESVGTLFGGATAFINLVLERMRLKGDESETLSRLMLYNPMGIGGYRIGAHSVRVVCANTLRMARAQSAANQSLLMIPHTKGAEAAIARELVNLAQVKLEVKTFNERVESLADKFIVNDEELQKLLDAMFPVAEGQEEASNQTLKLRESVQEAFDLGIEGIEPAFHRSRYALLNAATQVMDHPKNLRAGTDEAFVQWDGIVGRRAGQKDYVLDSLLTV